MKKRHQYKPVPQRKRYDDETKMEQVRKLLANRKKVKTIALIVSAAVVSVPIIITLLGA